MPCGKKRKRHKIATHKRKKRLRKNRHKKKIVNTSLYTGPALMGPFLSVAEPIICHLLLIACTPTDT